MIKNINFFFIVLVSLFIFFINLNKIETNFKAKLLYENKEVSLEELFENQDLSIINIWASWCLPCRDEHSYLLSLKSINNINIIGINYKDNEVNAKKFLEELGNPYSKILVDTDGINSIELGAYGVPETFLFDPKSKKIIKKYIGPINDINFKEIVKMKKFKLLIFIFVFFFIWNNNLLAKNSGQVDKISKNLRCLICQGQSVYDSQSDFAISMKKLVQIKIDEGKKENEIYDFFKNKYGEWIVYDPEINKKTFLLWTIPLILFVFGGLLIIRKVSIK